MLQDCIAFPPHAMLGATEATIMFQPPQINAPKIRPRSLSPGFSQCDMAAFTLVELLACIALISLLAVLLFPVAGRMRRETWTTRDASNLRLLAQASLLYAADHNGLLPPTYSSVLPNGTVVKNTAWWLELFPNYVRTPETFTSPFDDTGYSPAASRSWSRNGVTYPEVKVSYGSMGHCDGVINFQASGKLISQLGSTSRRVLYTNYQNPARRLSQTWNGQNPRWLTEISYVLGNGTAAHVAFVDGHVVSMTRAEMKESIDNRSAFFGTEAVGN